VAIFDATAFHRLSVEACHALVDGALRSRGLPVKMAQSWLGAPASQSKHQPRAFSSLKAALGMPSSYENEAKGCASLSRCSARNKKNLSEG
jgi:hypothetical protein